MASGGGNFGRNFRFSYHSSPGESNRMESRMYINFSGGELTGEDGATGVDYAIFTMFDGSYGSEAAIFARKNLRSLITTNLDFMSLDDNLVIKAISDGIMKLGETWSHSSHAQQLGSRVAITTISVVLIKNGTLYVAQIGDSDVVIGIQRRPDAAPWQAPWQVQELTKGRRAKIIKLDGSQRCLVFGNIGMWSVLNPLRCVSIVNSAELNNTRRKNAAKMKGSTAPASSLVHPAERLIRQGMDSRKLKGLPPDDLAAMVIYID